jgi:hypothetical protein
LSLPTARAGRGALLHVGIDTARAPANLPARLAEVLGSFRGSCPVLLDCRAGRATGLLRATPKVRADDELCQRLQALPGISGAEFRYDPPPTRINYDPLASPPPARMADDVDTYSGALVDSAAD